MWAGWDAAVERSDQATTYSHSCKVDLESDVFLQACNSVEFQGPNLSHLLDVTFKPRVWPANNPHLDSYSCAWTSYRSLLRPGPDSSLFQSYHWSVVQHPVTHHERSCVAGWWQGGWRLHATASWVSSSGNEYSNNPTRMKAMGPIHVSHDLWSWHW